jgi:hypothetical protein
LRLVYLLRLLLLLLLLLLLQQARKLLLGDSKPFLQAPPCSVQ